MTTDGARRGTSWWREIRRLDALQWRYFFLSLVLLPVIDLRLRSAGYQRTLSWLSRHAARVGAPIGRPDSLTEASKIARVVSLAGRRSPWRTTCLRQALLLKVLLARRGIVSELRLGVEKSAAGDLAAHAWVERDGQVLIGGDDVQQRYVVLR